MRKNVGWVWLAIFVVAGVCASAATVNLIVNPDFDRTSAPRGFSGADRPYVRGEHTILAGYGKEKAHPRGKAIDLVLNAPGVVDEIRISKDLRYEPAIPQGAKAVSYLAAADSAEQTAAAANPVKEISEAELDQERAKLVSAMPAPRAEYVFGADRAKCGWDGMPGMTLKKDYFGAGADGVELDPGSEPGRAAYWRLDGIQPGKHYVGLWVESGDARNRTEYWPAHLLTTAYLNGWPLRFATTTDPVQVKPGLWIAELQSAQPVDLKPGDELAFATMRPVGKKTGVALRLALYRQEPQRGHGVTGRTFGVDSFVVQRLRLVLRPEILGSGEDGAAGFGIPSPGVGDTSIPRDATTAL